MKKVLVCAMLAVASLSAYSAADKHTASVNKAVEEKAVWIDVRSEQEFAEGHLNKAVNIPVDQIAAKIRTAVPDKNTPVNLYCRSGRRAEAALQLLKQQGYTNVSNRGGYEDLLKKGLK